MTSNNSNNKSVGVPDSGATNTFTITNPSNTAGSAANEIITVGGSSAGNAWVQFTVAGAQSYSMGIDNASGDALQINSAAGSTVQPGATGLLWNMTPTGVRNMGGQPAFLAVLSSNFALPATNSYNLNCTSFAFNQGGYAANNQVPPDEASSGNATIFTAPVAGIYYFWVQTAFLNFGTSGAEAAVAITSNNGSAYNLGGSVYSLSNISEYGTSTIYTTTVIGQLAANQKVWVDITYTSTVTTGYLLGTPPASAVNTGFGGFLLF